MRKEQIENAVRKPREVCEPRLAPAGPCHPCPASLHKELAHAVLSPPGLHYQQQITGFPEGFYLLPPPDCEFSLREDCTVPCCVVTAPGLSSARTGREQHSCSFSMASSAPDLSAEPRCREVLKTSHSARQRELKTQLGKYWSLLLQCIQRVKPKAG